MIYLQVFLIVYGAFILIGMLLKFPFLYNNIKSRLLIKKMGIKGFNILLLLMSILFIAIGLLI
jgi:hypothetical protein